MADGVNIKKLVETAKTETQKLQEQDRKTFAKSSSANIFEGSNTVEESDFISGCTNLGLDKDTATAYWNIFNFNTDDETEGNGKLDDDEVDFWLHKAGINQNDDDKITYKELYDALGVLADEDNSDELIKALEEELGKNVQDDLRAQNEGGDNKSTIDDLRDQTKVETINQQSMI